MKQTALVIGGARGIGKQTSIAMGEKDWNVVFTSRNDEIGSEFEHFLRNEKRIDGTFLNLDVTNEGDVKDAIAFTVEKYGQLDCVVNNAGIAGEVKLFADQSTQSFRNLIETNLLGTYYGMKHAIHHFLKVGKGNIVNVASIAGLNGIPFASLYGATKHAVVGMTKAAAVEYAPKNIRVNAVAPGACDTDILNPSREAGMDNNELGALHPMNRLGDPMEVARAIAFLASDEASFITGAILPIDGAYTAK